MRLDRSAAPKWTTLRRLRSGDGQRLTDREARGLERKRSQLVAPRAPRRSCCTRSSARRDLPRRAPRPGRNRAEFVARHDAGACRRSAAARPRPAREADRAGAAPTHRTSSFHLCGSWIAPVLAISSQTREPRLPFPVWSITGRTPVCVCRIATCSVLTFSIDKSNCGASDRQTVRSESDDQVDARRARQRGMKVDVVQAAGGLAAQP
jgi:hypothetical protein